MKTCKISLMALGAALGMAVAAPASAERLSLSTWGSPQHPQVTEFVPLFVEKAEEKSDGEFTFRTFSGGEMVKQQFVPTAVPQGTVDISLTTLDNWSGRVPEVSILTSPLWTKSMEWTRDNLKPGHPIFDYFDEKLRAEGAMILTMFDIGPPVLSVNFPVEQPSDLQGKKIRVYSKGAGQVMQALGAAPTTIGVGEVYSALQRGTVDGAMGGLQGAVGLKHYEVTENLFVPSGALGSLIHAYVMNKDRFEAMSPEKQQALMDAAAEARDHAQQYMIDKYDEFVGVVEDAGNEVVRLEPGSEDWNDWQAALEGFNEEVRQAYPDDLVSMIEG